MIIWFPSCKPTILQNRCSSKNLSSNHPMPLNGYCGIQVRPPNSSDDLCIPLCLLTWWNPKTGSWFRGLFDITVCLATWGLNRITKESCICYFLTLERVRHRRRIDLEDKAKVVASDWGTDSLLRKLFCLGLLETNGWTQSFVSKRPRQKSWHGKGDCWTQ